MKLPYMPFYVGDWRKDTGVQALDFHDRGVWFEILCLMHESEDRGRLILNGAPMPEEALGRILGLDKQNLGMVLTRLLSYRVASTCPVTGALMSRRMVKDEQIRQLRSKVGKMGGNPALVKDKQKLNQNPNQKPEVDIVNVNATAAAFKDFWFAYPKKKAKGSAEKAWKRIKGVVELLPAILAAVQAQRQSEAWTKDGGQFIPHPATWLNDRRWEDEELPPMITKPRGSAI